MDVCLICSVQIRHTQTQWISFAFYLKNLYKLDKKLFLSFKFSVVTISMKVLVVCGVLLLPFIIYKIHKTQPWGFCNKSPRVEKEEVCSKWIGETHSWFKLHLIPTLDQWFLTIFWFMALFLKLCKYFCGTSRWLNNIGLKIKVFYLLTAHQPLAHGTPVENHCSTNILLFN